MISGLELETFLQSRRTTERKEKGRETSGEREREGERVNERKGSSAVRGNAEK